MVGQRIRNYLDNHGIKRTFLSEKTGLTSSQLTEIFCGRRKIEVMEYYNICKALKVSFDKFLVDESSE